MQDRQAEVIRLMKCVEVSTKRLYQLHWGEKYLLKYDYLLSLVFVSILVAYCLQKPKPVLHYRFCKYYSRLTCFASSL
jgi:hypothetical protein